MKQYEITEIKFNPIKKRLWDGKIARFEVWLDSFIPISGTLYENPQTFERWVGFRCVGIRTESNKGLFDWVRDAVLKEYEKIDPV